ncbi:MAG: RNA 2',3'-cyclic phosphodiesterase [Planctomycetota bacterium]|nr:RNA 2',3'-cyclic phosphodiesterase [Planctomycetota bacterium]
MRTFVAIDLDDTVERRIAALQRKLQQHCPESGIRWTDPGKIHITLKFLGETSDEQVARISRALDEVAATCRAFDVGFRGIGTFPPSGSVRVLWLGIEDIDGALADCQSRCEEWIGPIGFPPENRKFAPHLTLARNKNPKNSDRVRAAMAQCESTERLVQSVEKLVFYHSTLTGQGPMYEALSTHKLGS